MIEHKELKRILNYNPLTGIWIWKINNGNGICVGDIAGCIKSDGYRSISINNKYYVSSRLAWFYMERYWPENIVDHKDRNRSNDKWENLRHISQTCNLRNKSVQSNSPTGVPGVRWFYKKWQASIGINKRTVYLGSYKRFYDAVKARWSAEVKYGFPNCNTDSQAYKYLNMKRIKA